MNNRFDSFIIDVPKIYTQRPVHKLESLQEIKYGYSFDRFYQSELIPLAWRNYLWHILHRSNIDQEWFEQFSYYWEKVLGGKHLWGPADFHYLRNVYRSKFTSEVKNNTSLKGHLAAWQKPDSVYTLLHQVNKETLFNQINLWQLVRKCLGRMPRSFLEYGSGIAPITKSFFTFFNTSTDSEASIADIATLSFHYAKFRFAKESNLKSINLTVKNEFLLPNDFEDKVEVTFCITVFEHLHDPLIVANTLNDHLKSGGVLVFDYPKSSGGGMDTLSSAKLRNRTLRYIEDNFEIVYGQIRYDQTTALCIVRKK